MPYIVRKISGEVVKVVEDGSLDQSTGIYLIGKGYVGYSEYIFDNFIRLAENFSNITPPSNPLEGQLWYNVNSKSLKIWSKTNGIGSWGPVTGGIGPIGYTGSASTEVGYTGSQGAPGEYAALGYTGSQGVSGYAGSASTEVGYTGSASTEVGYTGSQGVSGYTGSASTEVGYTGSQGVAGPLSQALVVSNSDVSISSITGALTVAGGVGVGGDLFLAGNINIAKSFSVTGIASFNSSNETIVALPSSTGTVTHDISLGSTFFHTTPSTNFVANITNVPLTENKATVVCICVEQGATPYLPSDIQINGQSQSIKWSGGVSPTGNASKIDIIALSLMMVGSTWKILGQASYFG